MALIGVGFRAISMAPASIGPVKSMILKLDAGLVARRLDELLQVGSEDIRGELMQIARDSDIEF
jgi:phosphotransferase system enzyme I (PtsP)